MAKDLSGGTVVIIIAGGILTFILLFIFAKRQIMRFALRSRRGPHVPVGHGAKKVCKSFTLKVLFMTDFEVTYTRLFGVN